MTSGLSPSRNLQAKSSVTVRWVENLVKIEKGEERPRLSWQAFRRGDHHVFARVLGQKEKKLKQVQTCLGREDIKKAEFRSMFAGMSGGPTTANGA